MSKDQQKVPQQELQQLQLRQQQQQLKQALDDDPYFDAAERDESLFSNKVTNLFHMVIQWLNANLVILLYLGSPFTWDKVFKVLRPVLSRVKNQRLLVHILFYISFSYLDEMLKTMFECEYVTEQVIKVLAKLNERIFN